MCLCVWETASHYLIFCFFNKFTINDPVWCNLPLLYSFTHSYTASTSKKWWVMCDSIVLNWKSLPLPIPLPCFPQTLHTWPTLYNKNSHSVLFESLFSTGHLCAGFLGREERREVGLGRKRRRRRAVDLLSPHKVPWHIFPPSLCSSKQRARWKSHWFCWLQRCCWEALPA